jgi:hypothetical protein
MLDVACCEDGLFNLAKASTSHPKNGVDPLDSFLTGKQGG